MKPRVWKAEDYRKAASEGLSKAEAARRMNVSVQCVDDMAVRHNIIFRDGRNPWWQRAEARSA